MTPVYRKIAHAQMNVVLEDDGYFDWPAELVDLPLRSHWVYLDRSQIQWVDFGPHSLQTQISARNEFRTSIDPLQSRFMDQVDQNFMIISPSPENPQVQPQNGLEISWTQGSIPQGPVGRMPLISLIFKDNQRTDLILCELETSSNRLLLPSEAFSFWPIGSQSIRQLTLRNTFKEIIFESPDRGQLTQGVSLILQLQSVEE